MGYRSIYKLLVFVYMGVPNIQELLQIGKQKLLWNITKKVCLFNTTMTSTRSFLIQQCHPFRLSLFRRDNDAVALIVL